MMMRWTFRRDVVHNEIHVDFWKQPNYENRLRNCQMNLKGIPFSCWRRIIFMFHFTMICSENETRHQNRGSISSRRSSILEDWKEGRCRHNGGMCEAQVANMVMTSPMRAVQRNESPWFSRWTSTSNQTKQHEDTRQCTGVSFGYSSPPSPQTKDCLALNWKLILGHRLHVKRHHINTNMISHVRCLIQPRSSSSTSSASTTITNAQQKANRRRANGVFIWAFTEPFVG